MADANGMCRVYSRSKCVDNGMKFSTVADNTEKIDFRRYNDNEIEIREVNSEGNGNGRRKLEKEVVVREKERKRADSADSGDGESSNPECNYVMSA